MVTSERKTSAYRSSAFTCAGRNSSTLPPAFTAAATTSGTSSLDASTVIVLRSAESDTLLQRDSASVTASLASSSISCTTARGRGRSRSSRRMIFPLLMNRMESHSWSISLSSCEDRSMAMPVP